MSAPRHVNLDPSDIVRVREYVEARVDKDPATGCWPWRLNKLHAGHGQAKYRGYPVKAHRLAYAVFVGEPGDLNVLHKCDNPPCCNPEHHFLGTKGDNNRDAGAKGRYAMRLGMGRPPTVVITEEKFWACLDLLVVGGSYDVVASAVGVPRTAARDIATKADHWSHAKYGRSRSSAMVKFLAAVNPRIGKPCVRKRKAAA